MFKISDAINTEIHISKKYHPASWLYEHYAVPIDYQVVEIYYKINEPGSPLIERSSIYCGLLQYRELLIELTNKYPNAHLLFDSIQDTASKIVETTIVPISDTYKANTQNDNHKFQISGFRSSPNSKLLQFFKSTGTYFECLQIATDECVGDLLFNGRNNHFLYYYDELKDYDAMSLLLKHPVDNYSSF